MNANYAFSPRNVLLLLLSAWRALLPGILLCSGPLLAGLKMMVSSRLCCDLSRGNPDVWQTAFHNTQCLHYPQTLGWPQLFTWQPLLAALGARVQCKFGLPPALFATLRCQGRGCRHGESSMSLPPPTPHLVFGAGEGLTSRSPLCPGGDILLGAKGRGT